MPVLKSLFDANQNISLFTLANKTNELVVNILDYGATIVSVLFADQNNTIRDVVLGFDDLDAYQNKKVRNPYFGATIGRVANRIGNATFELNGRRYDLCANSGLNSIHGGPRGFDKRKWHFLHEDDDECSVTLQYISSDGEEGYPGALKVQITFKVTDENELKIDYLAELDNDSSVDTTIVNLTNHSYFNLNGAYNAESSKILNHLVRLNTSKYLDYDDMLIPTGLIQSSDDSVLDFYRKPYAIGDRIDQVQPNGYDHCYVLENNSTNFKINPNFMREAAQVYSPLTKIKMTLSTTEPAFQFYTGSKIVDGHIPKKAQTTDKTTNIGSYSGFCLEAQRFPDAINKDEWKSQVILSKGESYSQCTVYKFELSNGFDE